MGLAAIPSVGWATCGPRRVCRGLQRRRAGPGAHPWDRRRAVFMDLLPTTEAPTGRDGRGRPAVL